MVECCEVIVVGGGVIGLSCALRLQQGGAQVTVIERGEIGRAASWAGAGMVDAGSLARTDPLAELRRASAAAYPRYCAEIHALSGVDPEWTPCGSLDLIDDANQSAAADREVSAWERLPRSAPQRESLRVERLRDGALRAIEAGLADDVRDALHCPFAGHVRSPRLLRGLRLACEKLGVRVVECAGEVRLEPGTGRRSVVANQDCTWEAGAIVVAAGAWSSRLHPAIAALAVVRPIRGQIVALAAAPGLLRHVILRGKNYLVPRRDGVVLVGSSEEDAGYDVRTTEEVLAQLRGFAVRTAPALSNAPVVASWAGLRPASSDGRPYIGPCGDLAGVFIATGHFRSGLTLAPMTAELICAAVMGRPTPLPLEPFLPRHVQPRAGRLALEAVKV